MRSHVDTSRFLPLHLCRRYCKRYRLCISKSRRRLCDAVTCANMLVCGMGACAAASGARCVRNAAARLHHAPPFVTRVAGKTTRNAH